MADFLLELRTEEIPARMQARAADDLAARFGEAMASRGVAVEAEAHVTPRRLALIARGLPAATEATREERRGPRADAPPGAIAGFAHGAGVAPDALVARDDPKGRFLYAVIERPGRALAAVLAEAVPEAVARLAWPKSMRWGAASASMDSPRWVRPLSGVVALLDDAVVPMTVLGLAAGRSTMGHRFMGAGAIEVASAASYVGQLRDGYVVLDAAERRGIIEDGARAAAAAAGLELIEDAGLVAENAGLTEWPVPLLGRFEQTFLEVPREAIQLTMRVNQKYFACVDAGGKLAPAFVCVANIAAADGGAGIVEGNRRVLAARLSDARFFWEQDLREWQAGGDMWERFAPKLERVVFHEKLGTMRDKAERVGRLARWLVESGAVPGANADLAERAGRLAKADLVSAMVGEFPELQGLMSGRYALATGEAAEVAAAMRDHYRPVGPGDAVPTEPVSVAVALADKLDTLGNFFSISERPSGSRDPFALRRATLGVISLLVSNQIRGSLLDLFALVTLHTGATIGVVMFGTREFFIDRLKVQQREAGVRHDLIDAVFALGGEDDIVRLLARVGALQAFIASEDGANLLAGYKRAANILAIEARRDGVARFDTAPAPSPAASPPPPPHAGEELARVLGPAAAGAADAVAREDFGGAMAALARLRAPIDAFFETVLVNDPDPQVRLARLSLLQRFHDAVHNVADFSRIEG